MLSWDKAAFRSINLTFYFNFYGSLQQSHGQMYESPVSSLPTTMLAGWLHSSEGQKDDLTPLCLITCALLAFSSPYFPAGTTRRPWVVDGDGAHKLYLRRNPNHEEWETWYLKTIPWEFWWNIECSESVCLNDVFFASIQQVSVKLMFRYFWIFLFP